MPIGNIEKVFALIDECRKIPTDDLMPFLFYLEEKFECYEKWYDLVPKIKWPANWEIQFLPSYSALLRGRVWQGDKYACFYLDGYDMLGRHGEPYWETFCPLRSDCWRFDMKDTSDLLENIAEILRYVGPPAGPHYRRSLRGILKDESQ
jgi:hypothetical protein